MAEWRQGSAIHGAAVPDDPRNNDWAPPPGLLSKNERGRLSEAQCRTLGRNRLGFYELACGRCAQPAVVHVHELSDDLSLWVCTDCRDAE